MSSTQTGSEPITTGAGAALVDLKLEVVIIPVSDIDRAKRFYTSLGWRLDAEFTFDNGFHGIQFTPPGSPCSIQFGTNMTTAAPGSAQNLYLVVSDIEAARKELAARGVAISEVFHPGAPGAQFQPDGVRLDGAAADHASYFSFATFRDPDGNGWLLQEVTARLPGRGLSVDLATLIQLLREAEVHHGEYEPTAPPHHWSEWYGRYIVSRERGSTIEEAARQATRSMPASQEPAQA
ncbi:MAG TPA: VOC family protein [Vicinamibacterales bacterium]|jgi:catechol 2,3-dioxygenase-like lactoylglutathione lyase family enzyme